MLLVMRGMWDRIEPAWMEGMAATDASGGQPGAAQRAVRFDGFQAVLRAGRIETAARAEQWAQHKLVSADQEFQDGAHVLATRFQRVARLARNVVGGASA